jgi:hypothetical protein
MNKNNWVGRSLLPGICCLLFAKGSAQTSSLVPGPAITIPLGGNAWSNAEKGGRITPGGVDEWSDKDTWFDVWFRVTQTGSLHLWLTVSVPEGKSRIHVREGAFGAFELCFAFGGPG